MKKWLTVTIASVLAALSVNVQTFADAEPIYELSTDVANKKTFVSMSGDEKFGLSDAVEFDIDLSHTNTGDKVKKSVQFATEDTKTKREIVHIEGSEITVFGTALPQTAAETGGNVKMKIFIDSQNKKFAVRCKDEDLLSGSISKWFDNTDSGSKFIYYMYISAKTDAGDAKMSINSAEVSNLPEYSFVSSPGDGELVSTESFSKISLSYGTAVTKASLAKSNYTLYEDDSKVDFTVEENGNGVKIKSKSPWKEGSKYTLETGAVASVFGTELSASKKISFTVAQSGYELPEISFEDISDREIHEGEKLDLNYTKSDNTEKVEIYVNNVLDAALDKNASSYEFNKNAGSYEVQAVAIDKKQGRGSSEKIKITVLENSAPKIAFTNASDNETKNLNDEILIAFSDDCGIEKAAIYADGEKIYDGTDAEVLLKCSDIGCGSHEITAEAADIYGKTASAKLTIKIIMSIQKEAVNDDFSDYKKNAAPTGFDGYSQRGYLKPDTIDKEHGISCLVGISEKPNAQSDSAWLGIKVSTDSRVSKVSFDAYVNEKTNQFRITARGDGDDRQIVSFGMDKMSVSGNLCDYETKKWYHFELSANMSKNVIDILVTDSDGNEISNQKNLSLGTKLKNLYNYRIYGPTNEAIPTFIAIDNVKVTETVVSPLNIVNAAQKGRQITASFDGGMKDGDIPLENISITSTVGKPAEIKAAQIKSGTLKVTLSHDLTPNVSYTIKISGNTKFYESYTLGGDISGSFVSENASFGISGDYLNIIGQTAEYAGDLVNSTSESKSAVVILQNIKDGKILSQQAVEITADAAGSGNDSVQFSLSIPYSSGTLKAYVWDGADTMNSVVPAKTLKD